MFILYYRHSKLTPQQDTKYFICNKDIVRPIPPSKQIKIGDRIIVKDDLERWCYVIAYGPNKNSILRVKKALPDSLKEKIKSKEYSDLSKDPKFEDIANDFTFCGLGTKRKQIKPTSVGTPNKRKRNNVKQASQSRRAGSTLDKSTDKSASEDPNKSTPVGTAKAKKNPGEMDGSASEEDSESDGNPEEPKKSTPIERARKKPAEMDNSASEEDSESSDNPHKSIEPREKSVESGEMMEQRTPEHRFSSLFDKNSPLDGLLSYYKIIYNIIG